MRTRDRQWKMYKGALGCWTLGNARIGAVETPPVDGGDLGRVGAIRGGVAGTARPWGNSRRRNNGVLVRQKPSVGLILECATGLIGAERLRVKQLLC